MLRVVLGILFGRILLGLVGHLAGLVGSGIGGVGGSAAGVGGQVACGDACIGSGFLGLHGSAVGGLLGRGGSVLCGRGGIAACLFGIRALAGGEVTTATATALSDSMRILFMGGSCSGSDWKAELMQTRMQPVSMPRGRIQLREQKRWSRSAVTRA